MVNVRPRSIPGTCGIAISVVSAAALLIAPSASAQRRSLDRRERMISRRVSPAEDQRSALAELERQLGGSLLSTFDPSTGVTRTLVSPVSTLTPPAPGLPAVQVAIGFVRDHLALLGLAPSDLSEVRVCDVVPSAVSGATYVHFCQNFRGIPVFNARLQVNVSADGSITGVSNSFVPSLASLVETAEALASDSGDPQAVGIEPGDGISTGIDAEDAVDAAGRDLSIRSRSRAARMSTARGVERATRLRADDLSREPIPAELQWLPIGRSLRLVWRLQVQSLDGGHVYEINVDATRGLEPSDPARVLTRFDLVSDAQYQVYPQPVESPNHTSPLPPSDARIVVVDPADALASPYGWQSNGSQTYTTLQGNNVHAYQDQDANNQPPSSEPTCASGDCSFPLDLTSDPTAYTAASIANVFYWTNRVHDVQYHYGFDELAGNFQVNNSGRGGAGNDELLAEIQDGGGTNNANMLTPADGSRPRMQMYLWTQTTPRRDGALDAGVVVHEYGHGISNRLVGGPSAVTCLVNNQQPGEGLSDWWALAYTAKVSDTGPMPRGIGTYVLGQSTNGAGIRTQRYSTDPAVNTETYASIKGMAIPHGVGEVWAQAAWEAYWALVDLHGFDPDLTNATGDAGNQRMMLYVNEGLKATACSPTFTDVRDGILQAAMSLHGGEDVCPLWRAFAGFGLGVDAVSGGPSSTSPTNGFALPASCDVGPRLVSPLPGSTLSGPDVTFEWDPHGSTVESYELWVGTSVGANDLYSTAVSGSTTSQLVQGLPQDGSTLYVRLRFLAAGSWDFKDATYTASSLPPAMVSPVPSSALPGPDVTFTWASNGAPVLDYWMYVGTTAGGKEILDTGSLGKDTLSRAVTGLPTDGKTLFVRLYWFVLVGGWQYADYTYTASATPFPGMTSPAPGSTLPGPDVVFSWTDNGATVEAWELWVGKTPGGQEYFSGAPATTSAAVTGIPKDGSVVYVRLRFRIGGVWSFRDYTYIAATGIQQLVAPPPGSTLPGSQVTFQWTADGTPVAEWWLYLGSTVGAHDLLDSGSVGLATSIAVNNLPTDGRTIYARLWYRLSGKAWASRDATYVAFNAPASPPQVTSPAPGTVLPGSTVTFSWTANNSPVTQWWIYLGTTPGAKNIFDSGSLGLATTKTVTNVPTDGAKVYLQLWYLLAGQWKSTIVEYSTANLSPGLTSPAPGSTLTLSSVRFTWAIPPAGAPVAEWALYVGTSLGANNLFNSGSLGLSTFVDVSGLPTDGRSIYARLYYRMGNIWRFVDAQYVAATLPSPAITSPVPGTMLPGASATFVWEPYPGAQPVTEWWLYVGPTLGSRTYFDSGSLGLSRTVTVGTLPTAGQPVYVRLWFKSFGVWKSADYQYKAFTP
jgi:extracellular elastinolytic metalloproteinase